MAGVNIILVEEDQDNTEDEVMNSTQVSCEIMIDNWWMTQIRMEFESG